MVRKHAEAIAQRGLFAEVRASFLRDSPHPREIISTSNARDIYIVPFMALEGLSIEIMVPLALGLPARYQENISQGTRQRIHVCKAVGTHPVMIEWINNTIDTLLSENALAPDETTVLFAAHGTERHPGSTQWMETVMRDCAQHHRDIQMAAVYLEQSPRITTWREHAERPNVIVIPYVMTPGRHGAIDIPVQLGLDPIDIEHAATHGHTAGPLDSSGHKMWYAPVLGACPDTPDIIIERVLDWDRRVGDTV